MRSAPSTIEPPAAVNDLATIYAIAADRAETAAQQYEVAMSDERASAATRLVFAALAQRARVRSEAVASQCAATVGKSPQPHESTARDLLLSQDLSDCANSALSTPYSAWALAVRHGDRDFVFWSYLVAQAAEPEIRAAAEGFGREALQECNWLRRQRRQAWHAARDESDADSGEVESAALLESLLLRDITQWAQQLAPADRDLLTTLGPSPLPPAADPHDRPLETGTLDEIRTRALRRAEQLSSIYLDQADHAGDHASMTLAQQLAGQSIVRLAQLRRLAASAA